MDNTEVRILTARDIRSLLAGRELEIIDLVRRVYETHARGNTVLPHSTFLHCDGNPNERIIALPAYLGETFDVAGIKWISSFPKNIDQGLNRAAATIILNSVRNGTPQAILEGSLISAKRTAASAVLAAQQLHSEASVSSIGIVGCGVINMEVCRFLLAAGFKPERFMLFDKFLNRVEQFAALLGQFARVTTEAVEDLESVLSACRLVSFATTAITPHVHSLEACFPGTTILHISLRDIDPDVLLSCDNIVDDIDHVCRAGTSVHLASQRSGNRDFITGTLGSLILNPVGRRPRAPITVFSPFGLGVLDVGLAQMVLQASEHIGAGTLVDSFLPEHDMSAAVC